MADVNVNLSFTADTSKAKSSLQDLQQTLNNLTNNVGKNSQFKMTDRIIEASQAASELKYHLEQATNVKTGNLDFQKLNASFKESGMTLADYGKKLMALGPEGQQAFSKLISSVSAAEIPIKRANSKLQEFAVTLKNTAKWQISSSLLHGFMGAIQSAYGYAQDLNESLNNIRIVTGYGVDKMAQFAVEANKAAKALSTTTTNYTDASLIYYQQGLNDQEVKERTDVTIKLANVARESATTVSDQMTAVWNNFDDGSKSLEYYADVITKLGAATAASNSEIAEGIEKFSAISKTVGLSYEYATSALTTVVDRTRQSADVVGTAFKTMFARIQGLKLGETLEDGTTLNQYSQALQSVGINIKESNGELKDMDAILDEMGAKWKDLNRDEQVALAQKVAGVRQYQQLVSLMENYDFFKENVELARGSTGALQEQADIYAESWEAASKRVKASAETIYSDLLNDKGFIEILNAGSKVLDMIDGFIKQIGGLKGVLAVVSTLITTIFEKQIATSFQHAAESLKMMTSAGREAAQQAQQKSIADAVEVRYGAANENAPESEKMARQGYQELLTVQQQFIDNQDVMSEAQKRAAQDTLTAFRESISIVVEEQEAIENLQAEVNELDLAFLEVAAASAEFAHPGDQEQRLKLLQEMSKELEKFKSEQNIHLGLLDDLEELKDEGADSAVILDRIESKIKSLESQGSGTGILGTLLEEFQDTSEETGTFQQKLAALIAEVKRLKTVSADEFKDIDSMLIDDKEVDNLVNKLDNLHQKTQQVEEDKKRQADAHVRAAHAMEQEGKSVQTVSQSLVQGMQSISSLFSSFYMLKGLWDTIKDPDTSGIEKFFRVFSTGMMVLPMMISSITSLKKAWKGLTSEQSFNTIANGLNTIATTLNSAAKRDNAKASEESAKKENLDTAATGKNTIEKIKNAFAQKKNSSEGFGKLIAEAKNLGGVLKSLAATAAPVIIGITAVAAAIAAGSAIWNSANREAERANQLANELTESLSHTTDAYNTFSQSVKSYEDVSKSLDDLVAGTEEYKEALFKANEEAMKLIHTYKELKYDVTKEGLIVINPESLKTLKETQTESLKLAQTTTLLAQEEARRAEIRTQEQKLNRQNIKSQTSNVSGDTATSIGAGALAGTGAGLAIGAILGGPIGAAIGAMIGASAGIAGGTGYGLKNQETSSERKAIASLADSYKALGNSMFADRDSLKDALKDSNIDINDDQLIDSLLSNKDSIIELITATNDNSSKIFALNATLMGDAIKDSAAFEGKSANQQKLMASVTANQLASKQANSMEVTNFLTSNKNGFFGSLSNFFGKVFNAYAAGANNNTGFATKDYQTYSIKQLRQAYAEEKGYDASLAVDEGKESTKFFDEQGNEIETISNAAMRVIIAQKENQADILKSLEENGPLYDSLFNKLEKFSKNNDIALEPLLAMFGGDPDASLTSFTKEQLIKIEDELINGGYFTPEELGILNLQGGLEGVFQKLNDQVQKVWDSISEEGQKIFGKYDAQTASKLESVSNKTGSSRQMIDDYYSSLSEEDKKLFLQIDFDTNQTKAAWDHQLEILQNQKNIIKIKAEIENLDEIKAALEKGDYTTILNKVGSENFADFMSQTKEEQAFQIDQARLSNYRQMYDSASSMAESAQQRQNEVQNQYQNNWSFQDYRENGESKQSYDAEAAAAAKSATDELNQALIDQQTALEGLAACYGVNSDELENVADGFQEMYKNLELNEIQAAEAAAKYMKLQDAIIDLNDHTTDYKKVLKDLKDSSNAVSKSLVQNSDNYKKLRKSMAGLLGVSEDLVDADFLGQLDPKELEKAAKGDQKAIEGIRDSFASIKTGLPVSEIQNFKKQLEGLEEGATIPIDVLNDTALGKFIQTQIAAATTEADLRERLSGIPIDFDIIEMEGTLAEAEKMAADTGGVLADNLSMEAEINPASNVEKDQQEQVTFTENFAPVGTTTATSHVLEEGATDLSDVTATYIKMGKTVDFNKVTENSTKETSADSVNVKTGGGKEGKVGKHTIVKPKKQLNTTGKVAPSTTNAVTCFVAGTLISKVTGFETIENIRIGDIVLSYNEQTHKNEYSEVLQTMIHITKEPIYKLFVEGDILEVTGIHRFFIKRNKKSQWISAQELTINDEVLFANHTWHKILNIEIDERYETVYNFEVANNHNYYVGKNQILAHNKGGSCFVAGTKVSLGQSFKNIEDIKIGDIVLSYNEQTHKNEYSEVLQTMIHYVNEEIYDLYIEDEVLSVTGIHRFYIKQNDFIQWIAAENLQVGDNVLLADGTWHKIKDIKVSVQLTTVYNFEVANNHNYYVGKNQILAHNKGGGSGGGKSTPAKKADYTKKSEVVDRYKKLEDQQNTINKNLTKYNKLADQAYGTGKLKAMNKILKAKQQELDIQKSLIKEAEHYLKIDQNDLKKVFVENGAQTARFDKDGNITNIENIMTAMYEHLHKLEVKYNSFATQEDQKEYEESTLQPYRENIKRVKDATTQYYDTKNYLDDAKEKYLDLQFEYISKKLEKANYKINLKLDFKQSEIDQFERELEKLENRAFSTAKRLQLLTAEVSNYSATNSLAKKGVKNILKNDIYKEVDGEIITFNDWMKKKKWDSDRRDTAYTKLMNGSAPKKWGTQEEFFKEWDITDEGIQALMDYRDTLIDARTSLDEIKEKVDSEVLTVIDRWTKALEKSERQIEHWSNVIDKYSDIIEQVGPKALYGNQASEKMASFRATEMNATLRSLGAHKSTYDTSLEVYQDTESLVHRVRELTTKENQKDYEKLLGTAIGKKSGVAQTNYTIQNYNQALPQLLAAREAVEDRRLSLLEESGNLSGDELITNLEMQKDAASKLNSFDRRYQAIEQRNSELETLIDTMDDARDKVHEERELMLDDLLKFLQLAQEDALARTNDAFTEFEKRITGMYQSIENIKEAFDLNKRLSGEYLQDYERVYELTKLNRNLEQKMDETSNIKAKEKLAQLQEKITRYAAEGVKMSQYDLEYMQKEYDLEVAKIALEEAQNAKSQVRLTRDAEGNYSYTYTADENQTAQAEQDYEDKMNDLLKLSNEYSERMLQEQLNMTEQMEESLRELAEQRIQGVITQEEYNKKAADIEAWWTEQYAYFASEREKASHNNMKVFMEDYDTYYSMEDKKIQVTRQFNDDLIKSYDEVYKEYEEAQIKRDTALDKLNKSYASGAISLQEYLDQFKQINKDYATETQTAEAQYREIMETAVKGNAANAASIKDGFNGIILDAESTFLPQHGATWKSAIEDVETFTNALIGEVSGDGQPAGSSLLGQINTAMTLYSKNVQIAMAEIGEAIDISDPENGWTVLADLIEKETTRASNKIESLATTMHTTNEKAEVEIRESVKKTKTWYSTTYPKLEATKKKLDETITTINNLIAAEAGVDPFTFKANTTAAADDITSLTNKLNKLKEASDAAEDPVKPDADTQKAGDNVKGLKGDYDDLNKSGKDAGKTVNPKADTKGASSNVKNLKGAYDKLNKSSATAAKTVKMKADTATAKKNVDALTQSYKNLQAAQQKAGSSGDGGGSGGGTGIRDLTNKEATLIAAAIQQDSGAKYGVDPYRTKNLTSKVGAANAKKVQDILDDWYAKGGSPYASKQAEKYDADLRRKYWMDNVVKTLGFDTGGYTGKWGADGRFALLHEKELVLNKQDTENMLAAVKTVREIAAIVDLQAQNANLARQYALNIGQLSGSLAAQALDQNVHITAEFPNVQDHNEIEMAINSLVNRAAQFAYHN